MSNFVQWQLEGIRHGLYKKTSVYFCPDSCADSDFWKSLRRLGHTMHRDKNRFISFRDKHGKTILKTELTSMACALQRLPANYS